MNLTIAVRENVNLRYWLETIIKLAGVEDARVWRRSTDFGSFLSVNGGGGWGRFDIGTRRMWVSEAEGNVNFNLYFYVKDSRYWEAAKTTVHAFCEAYPGFRVTLTLDET